MLPPWTSGDSALARRIRDGDFADGPLGPVESWPDVLRNAVSMILPAAQPMGLMWGPDLVVLCNDAFCALIARDERDVLGRPAREVWPDVWPLVGEEIERVAMGLLSVRRDEVNIPILRDGRRQDHWWSYAYSPIPDADAANGVGGVLTIASDVTSHVEARRRYAASERRLRGFVENMPQLVWRADSDGATTWVGPQWIAFTGQSLEDGAGDGWAAMLHPDDRERALASWRASLASGHYEQEFRVREAKTGAYRWFQSRGKAIAGEDGEPREWVGAASDVDDLRRLQEEQKMLLAELQHRVRNTLAIIRSIARRTGETAETVADFASHFEGRLNAFARTQTRLARDPGAGIDLEFIIAEELTACAAREGARVKIGGPKVALKPKAAETLTLAIHELATNSVKYGALSGGGGAVSATWSIARDAQPPQLTLRWSETGVVADPERPVRDGFGTELLVRTLPYELDATVHLDIGPTGVVCEIALPLGRRILA